MGTKEISKDFKTSMLIGNIFEKLGFKDETTKDWHGSEQCAELAFRVIDEQKHNPDNFSVTWTINRYINDISEGKIEISEHMNDDFHKGFIAGQVFGPPTDENLEKVQLANYIFDNNFDYGYFLDVLNDINRHLDEGLSLDEIYENTQILIDR